VEQRWRYLVLDVARTASEEWWQLRLERLGLEGWELVSIAGLPDGEGHRWVLKAPAP
jgi:hypothetical protein